MKINYGFLPTGKNGSEPKNRKMFKLILDNLNIFDGKSIEQFYIDYSKTLDSNPEIKKVIMKVIRRNKLVKIDDII